MTSSQANESASQQRAKMAGLLLGTAVGDALGLAREGLSRRRAQRLFGGPPLGYRLFFGRGWASDDTEHTCLVAQSLLTAPRDVERFRHALGWQLRWWLASLPAGIGWATLRAIVKLWLGFSPRASGVYSAGNGPATRSAVIGACFAGGDERLAEYVAASTRITHTDPRAQDGALAVAIAARCAIRSTTGAVDAAEVLAQVERCITDEAFRERIGQVGLGVANGVSPTEMAATFGLERGVTGYILDTVPLALFCWLRYPGDFRRAVEEIILLGGDTDSTAAIVGGLSGATLGAAAIPPEWLDRFADWPRSRAWLERLADRLARQFAETPNAESVGREPLFWPGLIPRNMFFAVVVVGHALRRFLPPY